MSGNLTYLSKELHMSMIDNPEPGQQVWSSGWNIPGFLPDDEPLHFDTWTEARAALREALDQAIYATDEGTEEEAAYKDAEMLLDQLEPDVEFCERVCNYVWWVQSIIHP
jgi:hypothetical protein